MNDRIEKLLEQVKVNDKIQKLAEQSGCKIDQLGFGEGNLEKFAELIVKECLTFIRPNSYFQAYPDNMIGGEDGVRLLETITNQIEEHFGVEK